MGKIIKNIHSRRKRVIVLPFDLCVRGKKEKTTMKVSSYFMTGLVTMVVASACESAGKRTAVGAVLIPEPLHRFGPGGELLDLVQHEAGAAGSA